MRLDRQTCARALETRAPAFDGLFFVGVSTTGIYCRPVCRARPHPAHCSFFPSAAAAEAMGYRPCLLCRPELAPAYRHHNEDAGLVERATLLWEQGDRGDDVCTGTAERLGVTPERLRRAFVTETAVSPEAFAQTRQLLFAKRLFSETDLPPTEVAVACGFADSGRLQALFKERYRLDPLALRRRRRRPNVPGTLTFTLSYRPPLAWQALLLFLGRRAVSGVEAVVGDTYYRTVHIAQKGVTYAGWISARPVPARSGPTRTGPARLALELLASTSLAQVLRPLLSRAQQAFDLACRPDVVTTALGDLAADHPGLRLPGTWDGFEILVRAILGQQVTVQAARTLVGRLTAVYGELFAGAPSGLTTIFPTAARLAEARPEDIGALGVVGARARALVEAAQAVVSQEVRLEPGSDPAEALIALRRLRGVGDWTAQYVVMRALSWPDAFPTGDRGILRALGEDDPRRAAARAALWAPWRSYAVMHLWQTLEDRQRKD